MSLNQSYQAMSLPLVSTPESESEPREVRENWLDVLPAKADVLRGYQREVLARAAAALRRHRRVLVQGPTGSGKCLGLGTPVLMADGTIRPVEQIAVGDLLIGPDSKPRRVLSLARGREAMYRVTPTKGDPYIVNESHILSLSVTPGSKDEKPQLVNISVRDYLKSNKEFRHRAKGWRSGVDWKWKAVPLDPYFLGAWLGDGDLARATLSSQDEAIFEAAEAVALEHGLRTVREATGPYLCPRIRIVGPKDRRGIAKANPVYQKLRDLGVTKVKNIPLLYRCNSRTVRLQVLAGLMDTDGSMAHGGFDFSSANELFAKEVAFLARSLGFAAYVNHCRKGCQTGVIGDYWRVSISGDCDQIPTRILRKQAEKRKQIKRVLVHGITVEPVGEGDYYGFELDGDRLFLLGDFTVTHNTHQISAVVSAAVAAGLRVLILATRTRLVRQMHERLDTFDIAHGVMAAALPGLTNWSKPVQVASVDTLYRRCIADAKMPLPLADVVIFDEAHLALGASRQAILNSYPNAWQFGFTATPAKTSGTSLREQFDALILGPSVSELVAAGMLVRPRIFNTPIVTAKDLKTVGTDGKTGDYRTGKLSELMSRPKLIGDVIENWLAIANGQRTLVFACDKAHGAELLLKFRQAGVAAEQLTDDDDDYTREEVIARLEAGVTTVVINCFLLSYGIDIPLVDCIVLARPTRSVVMYLQSIGRGMRPAPGKEFFTLIDHGRVIDSLGRPLYDRDWSLDSSSNVNQQARERMDRQSAEEKPRTCQECKCSWLITEEGANCPSCGWHPVPKAKPVQVVDAVLTESKEAPADWNSITQFFMEACFWYAQRWPDRWEAKPNSGRFWAWSQTRTRFKRPDDERMPRGFWDAPPRQATQATAGWLKSQQIRWAKGKAKQQPVPVVQPRTQDEQFWRNELRASG